MDKNIGTFYFFRKPIMNLSDNELNDGIDYCNDFLEKTEGDDFYKEQRETADNWLTAFANEYSRRMEEFNEQGGTLIATDRD